MILCFHLASNRNSRGAFHPVPAHAEAEEDVQGTQAAVAALQDLEIHPRAVRAPAPDALELARQAEWMNELVNE